MSEAVLVEANKSYKKKLCNKISPAIHKEVKAILKDVKKEVENNLEEENLLLMFQKKLEDVILQSEDEKMILVRRIISNSKCEYLGELMQTVFIVKTKILNVLSDEDNIVELDVPTIENFVFKCFKNTARNLWNNMFLFKSEYVPDVDKQYQNEKIKDLIHNSIEETIEMYLENFTAKIVKKNVLDFYKNKDEEDDDDEIDVVFDDDDDEDDDDADDHFDDYADDADAAYTNLHAHSPPT